MGIRTGGKRDHISVTVPESEVSVVVDFLSARKGTSRVIACLAAARSKSEGANEESGDVAKWRTAYA